MHDIVRLKGEPKERGLGQAVVPKSVRTAVKNAVALRLDAIANTRQTRKSDRYLKDQYAFTEDNAPEILAEIEGLAEGFAVPTMDLFAYLHAATLTESFGTGIQDGCSSFACVHADHGALVGKTRDYRMEHGKLQRLFVHEDPSWNGGRVLTVGSLGSPGVFSSGINAAGLAVVDTQVATSDHGIGWLRYFLMTRLLADCETVAEAVTFIRNIAHAGGGTLILADAGGLIAAAELGHKRNDIQHGKNTWQARTNHFAGKDMTTVSTNTAESSETQNSRARLSRIQSVINGGGCQTVEDCKALLSSHDDDGSAALCRHGENGGSLTISGAVFTCVPATIHFRFGNPCDGTWRTYKV